MHGDAIDRMMTYSFWGLIDDLGRNSSRSLYLVSAPLAWHVVVLSHCNVDRRVAPCRAATMILLPTDSRRSSVEMVTVEPTDLAAAHERDSMVSSPVISTTNPRAP